jgi:hypothetical protein
MIDEGYWPAGGCKDCQYVEPRKLRCRASEALKHVGEWVAQEENNMPKERPDDCPLYKTHVDNTQYVRQVEATIQQKTGRRYKLGLTKLDRQELLDLQRLLRDIEDEAHRAEKSKARKRGAIY